MIVAQNKDNLVLRAVRNIRKSSGVSVDGFSVYEALKYENLIIEKTAFDELVKRIGK